MARRPENEVLYKTVNDFFNLCLIQDRSLLWPDREFWTLNNLNSVKKRLIDSPILGSELSFEEKLEKQMTESSPDEWAIICDTFFIYFLPSSFISFEKKLKDISWAAQHGRIQLPSGDNSIWDALKNGFTRTSFRYHVKYSQFWLIIMFAIRVKENDDSNSVINNSLKMQQTLDSILNEIPNKTDRAYDMRHAMLYMAFPDFYERMISTRDKERIFDLYNKLIEGEIPSDIDESIRKIREKLSKTHGTPEHPFDFYSDLKNEWRPIKKELKIPKKTFPQDKDVRHFWWVNQGINLKVEIEGGFLWAPIKNKSGKPVYHWDTMRDVKVGDVVLHYANGALRYVSQVIESAVEEKRPESFGEKTWEEDGRLIRVEYHELNPPISLLQFNQRLQELNISQGPIDNTGGIKQGYLFRFAREAVGIIQKSQPDTMWPEFARITDIPLKEYNSWIFQANPEYFNLVDSLKVFKELRWTINQYKDRIHEGDTVYLWQAGKNAGIYAAGTIKTEPELMAEDEKELQFFKSTEKVDEIKLMSFVKIDKVLKEPVLRDDLLKVPNLSNLLILRQPAGTNFPVTPEQDTLIRGFINKDPGIDLIMTWMEIKDSLNLDNLGKDFEIQNLYFHNTDQIKNQIRIALQNGKNIILIGPPGTGKSKLAVTICEYYCGLDNYIMSTATSDWSTFETIGGYRPDSKGSLIFYPGIFLQCFHDKENTPINKWLIIDEINRADIDKAFGSLFSALTGDDITLPFDVSGKQIKIMGDPKESTEILENKFIIHPHWRIIATMNTFDKTSLYEMSYAFMRRFAFISIDVPENINTNLIKTYLDIWGLDTNDTICHDLSILWGIINSKRKIGPAIIQDLYRYVQDTDTNDYVGGIIMYILPQFEGLLEETQIEFIREVAALEFINKPIELKYFASEFFGLDIKKFK